MVKQTALFIALGIVLSSCGMVKRGTIPWEQRAKELAGSSATSTPASAALSVTSESRNLSKSEKAIRESLDLAFKDWKGVPYVLGGSGYSGVDCSSFMQIVFEDYFQIKLPRNTREQMKVGSSVRRNQIQMGDMVFFKTGRDSYHVGVMVNEQQFLHASTSSGVMISGLQESYWSERYLTTRRVL